MKRAGHVYLVGAGPGPASLLTLRAQELLGIADVLAYDDLVHPSLLEGAAAHCELIAVGYRAGEQADRPPPLHPLVLERALAGKTVVRLKSGDPLIFGRGGEEGAALAAAGVEFSFVPGITAALAAASACHLPLTWRGRASELRISTQGSVLAPPGTPCTWALYMPRHGIRAFTEELLAAGWAEDTPAAFVIAAAHRQQLCVRRTLSELAAAVAEHPSALPGLVIVGEALRDALPLPLQEGPLQGCRILIARARADASQWQEELVAAGADAWAAPWIKAQNLSLSEAREAGASLGRETLGDLLQQVGFILLPSAAATEGFMALLREQSLDLRQLYGKPLLAIGQAREVLARYHLRADFSSRTRQGLLAAWPDFSHADQRPGLIVSAGGEGLSLASALAARGAPCAVLPTVRFAVQYPRLPTPRPDFILAPHRKALRLLLSDAAYAAALRDVKVIACGHLVAELARELGCRQVIEVELPWPEGLVPWLTALWKNSISMGDSDGKKGSAHPLHGAW